MQLEVNGKLTAVILSAYDLPQVNEGSSNSLLQPSYVSMEILGTEVRTGPPSARHRDRNSFKFVSDKNGSPKRKHTNSNEISISAPLEVLYSEIARFKVIFGDESGKSTNKRALIADVDLSQILHVNEKKWVILHLKEEGRKEMSQCETATADEEVHGPTLRLMLLMTGPYRPEVSAMISFSKMWFNGIDSVASKSSDTLKSVGEAIPDRIPSGKFLLIPTVPLAAISVVSLPLLAGLMTIGLPFFLPILALIIITLVTFGMIGTGIYFSSKSGRGSATNVLSPLVNTFVGTNVGQQFLHQTGPRPSPVDLATIILPNDMIGQLAVSLIIDLIGSSSYLLPGVGEAFDITWAPIQTIILMSMFDATMPSLKYISFIEEVSRRK